MCACHPYAGAILIFAVRVAPQRESNNTELLIVGREPNDNLAQRDHILTSKGPPGSSAARCVLGVDRHTTASEYAIAASKIQQATERRVAP